MFSKTLQITFLDLSTLEKFKITLEQIIQTVIAGQDNYGNRIFLLTLPVFLCGKIFFFQSGKLFFPIFSSATLQRNTEIPNESNLLGLRREKK